MSESYIGLAPSYGVFEKQVIAGTTALYFAGGGGTEHGDGGAGDGGSGIVVIRYAV